MKVLEPYASFKKDGFGCAIEIAENDSLFPFKIVNFARSIVTKNPIICSNGKEEILIQLWDGSQCACPVACFGDFLWKLLNF